MEKSILNIDIYQTREVDGLKFCRFKNHLTITVFDTLTDFTVQIYNGPYPKKATEAMAMLFWIGVKEGAKIKGAECHKLIEFIATECLELDGFDFDNIIPQR